jgi:hypothetical protein
MQIRHELSQQRDDRGQGAGAAAGGRANIGIGVLQQLSNRFGQEMRVHATGASRGHRQPWPFDPTSFNRLGDRQRRLVCANGLQGVQGGDLLGYQSARTVSRVPSAEAPQKWHGRGQSAKSGLGHQREAVGRIGAGERRDEAIIIKRCHV